MARPTKRNPETEAKVVSALRSGLTRVAACAEAGISDQTLLNWTAGKSNLGFLESVRAAEGEAEAKFTRVLELAATGYDAGMVVETTETIFRKRKVTTFEGDVRTVTEEEVPVIVTRRTETQRQEFDWKAAESWLKRRRSQSWGDKQTTEVVGEGGGPVTVTIIEPVIPAGVSGL